MTIKTRKATTSATPDIARQKSKTLTRARKPAADKVADAKQADIIDASPVQESAIPTQEPAVAAQPEVALEGLDRPITGRGVFAVRTLGNAVSVEAAFLEENGNVLRLPAVFPNREYAQAQLEELWQLVNQHFDDLEKAAKAAK